MALNGEDDLNRPLRDFIIPKATNMRPSVVAPAIAANNFELKANLITMAQQTNFLGYLAMTLTYILQFFLKFVIHIRVMVSVMMPLGLDYFHFLLGIGLELGCTLYRLVP
jgi:hypothetical protein